MILMTQDTNSQTKIIILDFDGTIADSMKFLEDLAVDVMKKNLPLHSSEELRRKYISTTGLPFCEQVELFLPDIPSEIRKSIVDGFEITKKKSILDQPLFPEIKEVFEYLKEKEYILYISSSSLKKTIEKYFKLNGLSHLIEDICGYREDFQKGADHFNYIMNKHKVSHKEMIFIGDSLKDKERALLSNISFIGRIGLFTESDFSSDNTNCFTISSLEELKEIF